MWPRLDHTVRLLCRSPRSSESALEEQKQHTDTARRAYAFTKQHLETTKLAFSTTRLVVWCLGTVVNVNALLDAGAGIFAASHCTSDSPIPNLTPENYSRENNKAICRATVLATQVLKIILKMFLEFIYYREFIFFKMFHL